MQSVGPGLGIGLPPQHPPSHHPHPHPDPHPGRHRHHHHHHHHHPLASLCMCYARSWATLWFCSVVGGKKRSWVAKNGRWFLSLELLAFLPYILFVFRCWCLRFWGLVVCFLAFLFGFGRFSCWWLRFASKQLGCLFFGCSTCGFWRLFLLVFMVCFEGFGCLSFGFSIWLWSLFLLVTAVCFEAAWFSVFWLFYLGVLVAFSVGVHGLLLGFGCLSFGFSIWFWSLFLLVSAVCFEAAWLSVFWLFYLGVLVAFSVGVHGLLRGVWLSVFWLFYLVLVAFPVGDCGLLRSSLVVCFLAVFCWCSWFASRGLVVCLLAFLFGFGRFSCWWLRFASKQLGCLFFGCSTWGFWWLFLLVFMVCFWGLVVCLLAFPFGFGLFSCWCLRFALKQLGCLFFGCSTWGFWWLFLLVFVVCFWGLVVCLLAFPFGFGLFSCWCLRFARSSLVVCFLAVLLAGSGGFFCWCSWFASGVWLSVFWLLSFVVWVRCFVVCVCGWYGAPQNCQPWLCYQTCNP